MAFAHIETDVEISSKAREKLLFSVEEEGQVTVHCKIQAPPEGTLARIWETTFLIDHQSNHRSRLLHAEGITLYPEWTEVPGSTTLYFTLVFSQLPKSCSEFDFLEQISEPGGFYIANLKRNVTDVYHINLSE
jgi:hypothetical protein